MEFRASLLARSVNLGTMLPNVHHFLGKHGPAQDVVERRDVRGVGIDLRDPRDGAEFVLSTVLEGHRRTLVGNHRLRRVDNGLQNTFQVQRGGDFVADGHQHFQDFYFALGHQQAGVVEGDACRLIQAAEYEEVVFIKRRSVQPVDHLHYADQRFLVEQGGDHNGLDPPFVGVQIAANQPFVVRICNQHWFPGVGDVASDPLTSFLCHSLPGGWIPSCLMHQ